MHGEAVVNGNHTVRVFGRKIYTVDKVEERGY